MLNLEELVLSLNRAKHLFIGGVFPKVIYKNLTSDSGIIIKKVNLDVVPIYFNSEEEFLNQFADYHDHEFTTAFTLIDGLSEIQTCRTNSTQASLRATVLSGDIRNTEAIE